MGEFKGLVHPGGGWTVVRLADIELVNSSSDGSVTVWVRHSGSDQSKAYSVGKVPIDVILRALNVGAMVGEEVSPPPGHEFLSRKGRMEMPGDTSTEAARSSPFLSDVESRNWYFLRGMPDFLFWLEGDSTKQVPEWVVDYVAKNPGCLSTHEKFREFLGTRGYAVKSSWVTEKSDPCQFRPYLNKEQITRGFFETADLAWHFAMNHYFGAEGGA